MIIAALVGLLPSTTLWQHFAQWITDYLPAQSRRVVFETILGLSRGSAGFLSFGILATLWSASSGFSSLMDSLSIARGTRDTRSFWRKRVIAVCAAVVGALFLIASFGILALGHTVAVSFSSWLGYCGEFHVQWIIARWVATLAIVCLGIDLANYFLPDVPRRRWRWLSPGTLFSALILFGSSSGFNLYVRYFSNIPKVYGALAGFIMLLLFIYFGNLVLLIGAQTDFVLEKAAKRVAMS